MTPAGVDPADQQRRMWTIGDYDRIAPHLLPISIETVAELDVASGERVLDVAVGNGNAAIEAARRGAEVVGIDLTPAQVDRARMRCRQEGVHVELRVGDAQALDVSAGSFDVVMSVMGVIFAPDPSAAARELARACRAGGRIGVTSWCVDGWSCTWRREVAELLGADPPPNPSQAWETAEQVAGILRGAGLDPIVEQRDFTWRFESVEDAFDTYTSAAGPFVAFLELMDTMGTADEARRRLRRTIEDANVATDGTCVIEAPYLLATATR